MRRLTILLAALAALMLVPAAQAFAEGSLTVHVAGTGSGEVSSAGGMSGFKGEEVEHLKKFGNAFEGEPPIECSGPPAEGVCEGEMVEDEEVLPGSYLALHAEPAPGSEFVEYVVEEGECRLFEEDSGDCLITGEGGEASVTYVFDAEPESFGLSVSLLGSGEGTVTSSPTGISCPPTCSAEFAEGTVIRLKPEPKAGSQFTSWSGCDSEETHTEGFPPTCIVTMSAAKAVSATFSALAPPNLKLNIEEGQGTVVSNPAGLSCTGSAPSSCEATVAEGSVVLTASPAAGYAFKSWKGCDVGGVNGRQCTVTATGSLKTVGAKFYKVWSLEGKKSNPNGIFSTSPGGVNCGYGCVSSSAAYKEGALTLKAKPAKNFHFVEFKGGTGSASSCNGVTSETCAIAAFNSDSSIEEVYAENAKNTLTLTKEGGGQGFIKTKPTNVNCGYTCTGAKAEFFASEEVPVTVTLNKGTTQVTWTTSAGTCTAHALSCAVPMSAAHSLVAKFE